jgi:hypothetical protein
MDNSIIKFIALAAGIGGQQCGRQIHRTHRALAIKFEDWEDASSIATTIGHALTLSFDDLVVDDGQVMLPFRGHSVEPLVLQLDDSDQGLGKYMFDLQWPPSVKKWCDEVKRVPTCRLADLRLG